MDRQWNTKRLQQLTWSFRVRGTTVIFLLISIWGPSPFELGKLAQKWCELGKVGKSNILVWISSNRINTILLLRHWNWTLWKLVPWPLEHSCPNQWKSNHQDHHYLHYLLVVWVSLEAVLDNKEFVYVVSEQTQTVLTMRSNTDGWVILLRLSLGFRRNFLSQQD